MKISLEWLRDYLPGPLDAHVAGEALTHGGLPVELYERHGEDDVIDVEVTSNRGDCLSHVGVARELAALLDRAHAPVTPATAESSTPAASAVAVRIDAPDLCPHYVARVIRHVKVGPSPAWMVRRLEAIGLRSINNVVDVTNYVMFETGQPLHAFDLDRVAGGQIIVRRAAAGERMTSLDGRARELAAGMLVIADAGRPVALAGIMGGADSEVSAGTTNVLLESARFGPLSVRKAARALAMKSDSSYRFERGLDPMLPEHASRRAAQLICQTAGGEPLGGSVTAGANGYEPKTIALRLSKLQQVLGIEVPADEAVRALARDHCAPRLVGDRIEATPPSWRLDLNVEVDLVEEVARVIGYDRIPVRPEISIRLAPPAPAARAVGAMRDVLVAGGYFEAVTFSFVSDALAGDFLPAEAAGLPRVDAAVRKADARLRPSILPGLLEAVGRNENAGTPGARLFEIGSAFWADAAGKIVERRRVGLVDGRGDVRQVRGAVEALLARLDADRRVAVVPDDRTGFARGACGRVEWGGEAIGHLGRVDRGVAAKLSLREPPAAAELDVAALLAGARHVPQLKPLPRFPAVRRDLSLVVPEATRYETLDALARDAKPEFLEAVEYVTSYRGKPLAAGTKSVTLTLVFRSPAATLTSDQVEGAVKRVVDAAATQLGASLRT